MKDPLNNKENFILAVSIDKVYFFFKFILLGFFFDEFNCNNIKNVFLILCYLLLKNGETKIQVKIQPSSETESIASKDKSSLIMHTKTSTNEIGEFVFGDLCLHGVRLVIFKRNIYQRTLWFIFNNITLLQGSGWWKYEICYNKYIQQVHREKGKPDEIVTLGLFNMQDHIKWLSENEDKKPKLNAKGTRNVISHFYSSGSVCQKTGEKRETEVNIIN